MSSREGTSAGLEWMNAPETVSSRNKHSNDACKIVSRSKSKKIEEDYTMFEEAKDDELEDIDVEEDIEEDSETDQIDEEMEADLMLTSQERTRRA
jgi:hypothetical protein